MKIWNSDSVDWTWNCEREVYKLKLIFFTNDINRLDFYEKYIFFS